MKTRSCSFYTKFGNNEKLEFLYNVVHEYENKKLVSVKKFFHSCSILFMNNNNIIVIFIV